MSISLDQLDVRSSTIDGTGVFARTDLPKGIRLLEYVGERITKEESHRRCMENNPYIFHIDETYDLDGNVEWNPARFINHSCDPNCEAEDDEGHIWIITLREIKAGEELTFNYGYDIEDFESHPCKCGSTRCVGFIVAEEFFEDARLRNPPTADAGDTPEEPGPPT